MYQLIIVFARGERETGIKELQEAARLDGSIVGFHFELGDLLLQTKRNDEAVAAG